MSGTSEEITISYGISGTSLTDVLARMESIPGSSCWSRERLADLVRDEHDRSIIAHTTDARLCGFAVAYTADGLNPFMYREPCVILRRLFVEPQQRGRGLGAELLRRTFAAAEALPVAWQTSEDNKLALRWFHGLGIAPMGAITRGDRTDHIFWVADAPKVHDAAVSR